MKVSLTTVTESPRAVDLEAVVASIRRSELRALLHDHLDELRPDALVCEAEPDAPLSLDPPGLWVLSAGEVALYMDDVGSGLGPRIVRKGGVFGMGGLVHALQRGEDDGRRPDTARATTRSVLVCFPASSLRRFVGEPGVRELIAYLSEAWRWRLHFLHFVVSLAAGAALPPVWLDVFEQQQSPMRLAPGEPVDQARAAGLLLVLSGSLVVGVPGGGDTAQFPGALQVVPRPDSPLPPMALRAGPDGALLTHCAAEVFVAAWRCCPAVRRAAGLVGSAPLWRAWTGLDPLPESVHVWTDKDAGLGEAHVAAALADHLAAIHRDPVLVVELGGERGFTPATPQRAARVRLDPPAAGQAAGSPPTWTEVLPADVAASSFSQVWWAASRAELKALGVPHDRVVLVGLTPAGIPGAPEVRPERQIRLALRADAPLEHGQARMYGTVRVPASASDLAAPLPAAAYAAGAGGGSSTGLTAAWSRMARAATDRLVGVALGGGGALGYAHVPLLRGLVAQGVPIDMVSGASFGSIVGAYWCCLGDKGLDQVLGFGRRWQLRLTAAMFGSASLWEALDKDFGGAQLERLDTPLLAVATDLNVAAPYSPRGGPVSRAVMFSGSFPPSFPTVVYGGTRLADGGFSSNVPVAALRWEGASLVVAGNIVPVPPPKAFSLEFGGKRAVLRRYDLIARLRDAWDALLELIHIAGIPHLGDADVSYTPRFVTRAFWDITAGAEIAKSSEADAKSAADATVQRWNILRRPLPGVR